MTSQVRHAGGAPKTLFEFDGKTRRRSHSRGSRSTMNKTLLLAGLASLLLAGCGSPAAPPVSDATKDTPPAAGVAKAASACADEGDRLALTGLCAGRAVNYLNMDASASPAVPDGCAWQVMETPIIDDVLLYRGLKCNDRETKLEYAGGAIAPNYSW